MIKEIQDFENDVIERLSRVYYDELLYFTVYAPDALINFNDVLLLKKGQKYVSHTNILFQKSISYLFKALYNSINKPCNIIKTSNGRGINLVESNTRIHFLGQEMFINFPKVNWLSLKNSNDESFDLYAVLIQKNKKGISFINKANTIMSEKGISTKEFILLEDLVNKDFDKRTWEDLNIAMSDIETKAKDFQWFGLVSYYNNLNQTKYLESVKSKLCSFDYVGLLSKSSNPIGKKDLDVLMYNYLTNRGYELLLGDKDFCSSFITSEWLFDNLDIGTLLDKTYVVTGYIKSIEQLMFYLIQKSSVKNSIIGILDSGEIKTVDVQSENFYRATLGNMMYYLKSYTNRYIYHSNISNNAIKKSIEIINDWIKVERNGYFHKHNIQSSSRVAEIREKTYLLYFLLIGSIQTNEHEY